MLLLLMLQSLLVGDVLYAFWCSLNYSPGSFFEDPFIGKDSDVYLPDPGNLLPTVAQEAGHRTELSHTLPHVGK